MKWSFWNVNSFINRFAKANFAIIRFKKSQCLIFVLIIQELKNQSLRQNCIRCLNLIKYNKFLYISYNCSSKKAYKAYCQECLKKKIFKLLKNYKILMKPMKYSHPDNLAVVLLIITKYSKSYLTNKSTTDCLKRAIFSR